MVDSLTSFRFLTALFVFLFHCRVTLPVKLPIELVDRFFINSATFMSGFFVLSGFILTYVYQNTDFVNRQSISSFYLKRVARIYPTYIISTIVYFVFFHDYSLAQFCRVILNDIPLIQAFFPTMFGIGINGGTWSLSVEFFLYFIFPFLMLLCGKSWHVLIVGIFLSIILSLNVTLDLTDRVYAHPIFRIPDFLCGIGFYFLSGKLKYNSMLHFLTLILIFISTAWLGNPTYQYMQGQFILVPTFGLLVALVSQTKSKIYNNRILRYLGTISYSFYCWQFIALNAGKYLNKHFPEMNIFYIILIIFILNIVISSLSYHFIEKVFRRLILDKAGKIQSHINSKSLQFIHPINKAACKFFRY